MANTVSPEIKASLRPLNQFLRPVKKFMVLVPVSVALSAPEAFWLGTPKKLATQPLKLRLVLPEPVPKTPTLLLGVRVTMLASLLPCPIPMFNCGGLPTVTAPDAVVPAVQLWPMKILRLVVFSCVPIG